MLSQSPNQPRKKQIRPLHVVLQATVTYLAQATLCATYIQYRPNRHHEDRGKSHDPSQTIGPAGELVAPVRGQRFVLHSIVNEASLRDKSVYRLL